MAAKIAVLAVNPVNGSGLFQYLETFYENGIDYRVYAVAPTTEIKTNSGIRLIVDDVVARLKGHEDEFDGVVFSCGDAVPVFQEHSAEPYNVDMLQVLKNFAQKGKIMIGHCAAALLFEKAGVTKGRRLAVHPLAKPAIVDGIATDKAIEIDENFYTAQEEHALPVLLPRLIDRLKAL